MISRFGEKNDPLSLREKHLSAAGIERANCTVRFGVVEHCSELSQFTTVSLFSTVLRSYLAQLHLSSSLRGVQRLPAVHGRYGCVLLIVCSCAMHSLVRALHVVQEAQVYSFLRERHQNAGARGAAALGVMKGVESIVVYFCS